MIIEATASDFDALLTGTAPRNLHLVSDSAIAAPEVLQMLSNLASEVHAQFAPSAWMIVEDDEVVGLCSVVRVPREGDVHIGYGVAPSRQRRGVTTRTIAALLDWGRGDPRVASISAETSVENIASQRVLERNGFVRTGERIDAEDGAVICWQAMTTSM
jgi:RimJ/RimL family protein N-acetyltransferase